MRVVRWSCASFADGTSPLGTGTWALPGTREVSQIFAHRFVNRSIRIIRNYRESATHNQADCTSTDTSSRQQALII